MVNVEMDEEITKVRARRVNGACALMTDRRITTGQVVLLLQGEITGVASKYSIQIGEYKHLEPFEDPLDTRSLIRFLNHCCDPTAYINFEDLTVRALRDLEPGEEVTFNYNTTEYEMANPFRCYCESENCLSQIRGFKYLPLSEQKRINAQLAPHLRHHSQSGQTGSDQILTSSSRGMQIENVEDVYPLSSMQQGILFHTIYAPDSGVYFEQLRCSLHGEFDGKAMERAWQRVLDRYSILRTAFLWDGLDEPLQVVRRRVSLPWEHLDWRAFSKVEQRRMFESYLEADRKRGFELSRAPLMRLAVIRVADEDYHLIWSHHHLLVDGWSSQLILKEVFLFYHAFARNEDLVLEQSRPYRDYIAWLRSQDSAEPEVFWRRNLEGFTAPTHLPSSADTDDRGELKSYGEQSIRISEKATTALQFFARRHRLTLNTLVQGAWARLLSHYSGEEDILFGITVSGRPVDLAGVESMVGLFINVLPLRVQVFPEDSILPWLKKLQDRQVEIRQYEYCSLVEIQGWSDVPRGLPLFESVLVFDNYPSHSSTGRRFNGLEIRPGGTLERSNCPLQLNAVPGSELMFQLTYDRPRFDAPTIRRMLEHLKVILENIVTDRHDRVSSLSCVTEQERNDLITGFNVNLEA